MTVHNRPGQPLERPRSPSIAGREAEASLDSVAPPVERHVVTEAAVAAAETLGRQHAPPAVVPASAEVARQSQLNRSKLLEDSGPPSWVAAEERVVDAIAEHVTAQSLTYDTFFETVVTHAPRAMFEEHAAWLCGDRTQARRALARFGAELGDKYECLALDPGILFRADAFVAFARPHLFERGDVPALRLRRLFIAAQPVKHYFRGVVRGHSEAPLRVLSPSLSRAIQDLPRACGEARAAIGRMIAPTPGSYFGSLPFLTNTSNTFQSAAMRHVFNRETDSPFFSVSEYPEIAWYACCGREEWKDWKPDRELEITRFALSSFYALPRNILLEEIFARGDPGRRYSVPRQRDIFELSVTDAGVEALVPIALAMEGGRTRAFRPEGLAFVAPGADAWEG